MKTIRLKCSRLKTVHTLYNTLYRVVYINRGDGELHKMRNGACGIIIMVLPPKNRVKHTRREYDIRFVPSHILRKEHIKMYMYHGYEAILHWLSDGIYTVHTRQIYFINLPPPNIISLFFIKRLTWRLESIRLK